jgi:hypothetical protein
VHQQTSASTSWELAAFDLKDSRVKVFCKAGVWPHVAGEGLSRVATGLGARFIISSFCGATGSRALSKSISAHEN